MNEDVIGTHYVKRGYATADVVVLSESARTRVIFKPAVHPGGVRGVIVRQKIGEDGQWKDVNEVNFNTLPPDSGVSIELDTAATDKLHAELQRLYQVQKRGVGSGDRRYIVAEEGRAVLINDNTKARAISQLLSKGYSREFWSALQRDDPDFASQLAVARVQENRLKAIVEYEDSLTVHEGDESYWQKFFEQNPWMLQSAFASPVIMLQGETYVGGKTSRGRQGVGGVATDFLFSDDSTKSFAVVEIKTPSAGLVGSRYRGKQGGEHDNEIYGSHADLSGAVVQVRNQIAVAIEDFPTAIGRDFSGHGLNRIHPKGVLVAGMASNLTVRQGDSFNHFRHALHDISIIAFDELLKRLQILFVPESSDERDDKKNLPPF